MFLAISAQLELLGQWVGMVGVWLPTADEGGRLSISHWANSNGYVLITIAKQFRKINTP